MKTREILDKLPKAAKFYIDKYKEEYAKLDYTEFDRRNRLSAEMSAYVRGMRDCGFLTVTEARLLTCYMTIAKED